MPWLQLYASETHQMTPRPSPLFLGNYAESIRTPVVRAWISNPNFVELAQSNEVIRMLHWVSRIVAGSTGAAEWIGQVSTPPPPRHNRKWYQATGTQLNYLRSLGNIGRVIFLRRGRLRHAMTREGALRVIQRLRRQAGRLFARNSKVKWNAKQNRTKETEKGMQR